MAATDVVTLAEAKLQLNMTDSASDSELPVFISAASQAIEDYVGPVVNRSVTEVFDGGRDRVLLNHIPVSSITSVTEDGAVLASTAYSLDESSGVLRRVSGIASYRWAPGVNTVEVEYVAGRAVDTAAAPSRYKMAALIIVQHLWETQRPAADGPFSQRSDDFDPRYTYSVPRRALELLGEPIGGIA